MTITIRPETPADHDAIRRVVGAAFGSEDEADLVEAIRASPEYIADMALVALVDDRVVGHVMISGATIRTEHGDRRIVMLSPLAVEPQCQRTGVGGELVTAVVAIAAAASEPIVVVEGDPAYYSRFGFEFARPLGIEIPLPDWAPPEAGQVLRLIDGGATPSGVVIYPPAFDSVE